MRQYLVYSNAVIIKLNEAAWNVWAVCYED